MAALKLNKEFLSSLPLAQLKAIEEAPRLDLSLLTDHALLDKIAAQLTNELFKAPRQRKLNTSCMKLIIENLIKFSAFEYLGVFLSGAHFRTEWPNFPVNEYKMNKCVKALAEHQYVEFYFGQQNTGLTSRIKANKKLLLLLTQVMNIALTHREEKLIILKSVKIKGKSHRIEFQETEETRQLEANLIEINSMYSKHTVTFHPNLFKTVLIRPRLKRVFNVDFDHGGRFYSADFQSLKKKKRRKLRINGFKTVELDYSQIHAAFCYLQITSKMPETDAYTIENIDREIGKAVFQILINANSKKKALGACRDKLAEKRSDLKASDVLRAFEQKHAAISEAFFKGWGLSFMKLDSTICEKVMLCLARANIQALPIHDSFRVALHDAEALRAIMTQVSLEVLGVALKIK